MDAPAIFFVSIHAPAWGATLCIYFELGFSSFQSTPPHGGRPMNLFKNATFAKFQSTPPRGGATYAAGERGDTVGCFNPRPRVGGDSP